MTKLSAAAIRKIAQLSRLGLTQRETEQAARDLSGILNHFAAIQNIDTTNVPTYDNATGLNNVTRVDAAEPNAHCPGRTLLKMAPKLKDGHIKVKSVLNNGRAGPSPGVDGETPGVEEARQP